MNTSKISLLIISFILLVFIVAAGIYYFFVIPKTANNVFSKRLDGKVLENKAVVNTDPRQLVDTMPNSISSYTEKLNSEVQNLDENSIEARLLLVRKAAAMSLPRDVVFERSNLKETLNIFKNIIFAQDSPNDFPKSIAVVAFARMFDQWCFGANGLATTVYQDSNLNNYFKQYSETYKNRQIIIMSVVAKFLRSYSDDKTLMGDKTYLVITSKIEAILLRSFYKELTSDDLDILTSNLGLNLGAVDNAREITFKTYEPGLSEIDMQYAVSNDIYESLRPEVMQLNKPIDDLKIDAAYEKVLKGLQQYEGKDQVTKAMFIGVTSVYYTDSLKRRYGNEKDKYINQVLIPNFLKAMDENPTAKVLMGAYFRDGVYGASTWEIMKSNFISLANTNLSLKKLMISYGIKEADIVSRKGDWDSWNK